MLSIIATVIASADAPYPCQVTFTAYTSGYDDEVMIFDGACCEGEVRFRHVAAVKVMWTLELLPQAGRDVLSTLFKGCGRLETCQIWTRESAGGLVHHEPAHILVVLVSA
jgi:hypothetical protein